MDALSLLPTALSEMFADVSATGKVTLADRYGMMAAFLQGRITTDELNSLDRLFYAIRRGRIQIVDDLSAIAQTLRGTVKDDDSSQ